MLVAPRRSVPPFAAVICPAMVVPIAALNAFEIIGLILAAWAVILAAIGIKRHDFPNKKGPELLAIGITALLVAGAVGTAIGTAETENPGGELQQNENKPGREGSEGGGTVAPDTRPEETQSPGQAPTPQTGAQTLKVAAEQSGQLAFDKETLTAKPGNVTIDMENPSPVPHNVAIEGGGVNRLGKVVPQGETSTVSSDLKKGSYTFYCSVPGHREGGMEGKLTVE